MTIRQQLVAGAARSVIAGRNPATYITVHETGNSGKGANAAAHANLQSRGNSRNASWHYTVDDREAVQSYADVDRCKHAGDGSGSGNMASISIEVCVNAGIDQVQAYRNAAALVRTLMDRHGIPISRVVQHNRWSGKNCPTKLRAGSPLSWAGFLALVGNDTTPAKPAAPAAPAPEPAPTPKETFLMALSDQQQQAMYDRVMGALPGKENGRDAFKGTRVLDNADGQTLRQDIAASTARTVAETSSAFHQLVGIIGRTSTGQIDVAALAAALKPALGDALANELADRLKG